MPVQIHVTMKNNPLWSLFFCFLSEETLLKHAIHVTQLASHSAFGLPEHERNV